MTDPNITERLEYLRSQIDAECISMSELSELQGLAEYINPTDVQLLEWAGVPEFPAEQPHYPSSAELAAHRHSIDPHADDECPHAYDGGNDCPFDARADGGAWPAETRYGIGYRIVLRHGEGTAIVHNAGSSTITLSPLIAGDLHGLARREANRMRSAAYGHLLNVPDNGLPAAIANVEAFAPGSTHKPWYDVRSERDSGRDAYDLSDPKRSMYQ